MKENPARFPAEASGTNYRAKEHSRLVRSLILRKRTIQLHRRVFWLGSTRVPGLPSFPVAFRDTLPSQLRDSTGLSPVFLHSEAFCFVTKKADYPPKIIFALLYATEFHFTIRIPV